jgi:hypothetical protein
MDSQMNFSSFFPDFPAKKEQGFSISSAISVQNEAVGRRKKARRDPSGRIP